VISLFKLTKGALLVAVALALLRFGREGPASPLAQSATRLHVDPEQRYFGRAVRSIVALDGHQLEVVSADGRTRKTRAGHHEEPRGARVSADPGAACAAGTPP
jgi:hypothetical protein